MLRSVAGRVYWATPHFLSLVRGKVTILMYHRVVPAAERQASFVQPAMYVTPETFEAHLRFLKEHFTLLAFQDLLAKWSTGDWDPQERYCTITFDDGWLDNYQYAYPLLRAFDVPATIFLPTSLVGTSAWLWSDRLGNLLRRRGVGTPDDWNTIIEETKALSDHARATLNDAIESALGGGLPAARRFVNWDEAREMSRHGIAFGSHSATHADLARLDGDALDREMRESLSALRHERVTHVPVIAYPNGDYTDGVACAARAAGYRAAVTVRRGLESRAPADLFQLRRIAVHDDVSASGPALALHIGRQQWGART